MSVRFLHITDTHWSASSIAAGIDPAERLAQLCDWIRAIPAPIDWIVHTGDVVHRGHISEDDGASTRQAIAQLQSLPYPIHFVVGNHDHRRLWPELLGGLPGVPLSSERWAYHFVFGSERLVVLDGRDTLAIDPAGRLDDAQLQNLETLLRSTGEPVSVFLHYPPLPLDCDWIDRTMLLSNGRELHALLAAHANRIRGVFFGHVHRPVTQVCQGVLYASAGSSTMLFPNLPNDAAAVTQPDAKPMANYVTLGDSGTLIKALWGPD